ncbi:NADH dehydrogenase [ubiquinone] 1 beta subcomplex subunit 7-like [Colias croceus]|uniref:NADH dehydrogenase [ubiquinone] 1 beta subcomplex subunit 7-like n=1 Tax=Colias crocea TaxID=72248 RepID=UPI001E2811CA|nr:NADH dehydrogenase [ubiquinone] 1 beta subcomplex subunit 7-like [Colias croceus]
MGQILGTWFTRNIDLKMNDKPTFNEKAGFKYSRAKREVCAQEDHLISAKIPPKFRDYCAHCLLEYQVCRYKHMPLLYKCHHERHAYLNCEKEDYVLRMKEFERERRLREREIRIKAAKEK